MSGAREAPVVVGGAVMAAFQTRLWQRTPAEEEEGRVLR